MSSSLQGSSGGTVDIKDIFLRLKFPETRKVAYNQLKIFLCCNSNLSAHSQDLHNAISYVSSHTFDFSESDAFTVIDLALANPSTPAKAKDNILSISRLTTFTPGRVSSGLSLGQNLQAVATRQGCFLRVLDLLSSGRSLEGFISDIFHAMRSIASEAMFFTDEQYCKIADSAMAHEGFSGAQKEYFRMWKEYRSRTKRTGDDVEDSPSYASVLCTSGFNGLCQELKDPISHKRAYGRLTEMLGNLRPYTSVSELFVAIRVVASSPELFSNDMLLYLTDCGLHSQLFTEAQKKLIRAWREDRHQATLQFASGVSGDARSASNSQLALKLQDPITCQGISEPRAVGRKSKDQGTDTRNVSNPPLFLKLRDPTTCQEAYNVVLNLVTTGGSFPNYKSEMFNAINVIASQPKLFTNRQLSTLVRRAMLNTMFTDRQKKLFLEMEKKRRGKETINGKSSLTAEGDIKSTIIHETNIEIGVSRHPPHARQLVTSDSIANASNLGERNTGNLHVITEVHSHACRPVTLVDSSSSISSFGNHNACNLQVCAEGPDSPAAELDTNIDVENSVAVDSTDQSDVLGLWWNAIATFCSVCGGFKSRRGQV